MNELEPGRAQGEKKEVYYGWIVVAGVFFMVAVSCGSFTVLVCFLYRLWRSSGGGAVSSQAFFSFQGSPMLLLYC